MQLILPIPSSPHYFGLSQATVFMIVLAGSTINEVLFPQDKIKLRDTEKIKKIITTETIIKK